MRSSSNSYSPRDAKLIPFLFNKRTLGSRVLRLLTSAINARVDGHLVHRQAHSFTIKGGLLEGVRTFLIWPLLWKWQFVPLSVDLGSKKLIKCISSSACTFSVFSKYTTMGDIIPLPKSNVINQFFEIVYKSSSFLLVFEI